MRVDWPVVLIGVAFLGVAVSLGWVLGFHQLPLCEQVTGNIDGTGGTACRKHVIEPGRLWVPALLALAALGVVGFGFRPAGRPRRMGSRFG